MKIIIDERETALFSTCVSIIKEEQLPKINKRVLNLGDILIVDEIKNDETEITKENILVIIERKSISDLLASIKDGRYEEQSYRLQHSSGISTHNILYIIEGMFSQLKTPQDKKMVLSAITSLNYFKGFSVIRTCSVTETAEFIINMSDKMERDIKKGKTAAFSFIQKKEELSGKSKELEEGEDAKKEEEEKGEDEIKKPQKYCEVVKKVKKENITKENMGEIILCQIPGISSVTAIAIMKYVEHSFPKLIEILKTSPEELQNIKIGDNENKLRKINKKNVDNMIHFLL
jgi:ERCC4-type nuclease